MGNLHYQYFRGESMAAPLNSDISVGYVKDENEKKILFSLAVRGKRDYFSKKRAHDVLEGRFRKNRTIAVDMPAIPEKTGVKERDHQLLRRWHEQCRQNILGKIISDTKECLDAVGIKALSSVKKWRKNLELRKLSGERMLEVLSLEDME